MFKKTLTTVAMAAALGVTQAQAATMEDVDKSFFPYKDGGPTFAGLTPGMTINSGNVAQFKEILDAAMFQKISDGWLEMTVGETTSFDLHPNYVQATRDNLGKVSLGNELGQINGFVAGRPFPEEPDANDPFSCTLMTIFLPRVSISIISSATSSCSLSAISIAFDSASSFIS